MTDGRMAAYAQSRALRALSHFPLPSHSDRSRLFRLIPAVALQGCATLQSTSPFELVRRPTKCRVNNYCGFIWRTWHHHPKRTRLGGEERMFDCIFCEALWIIIGRAVCKVTIAFLKQIYYYLLYLRKHNFN